MLSIVKRTSGASSPMTAGSGCRRLPLQRGWHLSSAMTVIWIPPRLLMVKCPSNAAKMRTSTTSRKAGHSKLCDAERRLKLPMAGIVVGIWTAGSAFQEVSHRGIWWAGTIVNRLTRQLQACPAAVQTNYRTRDGKTSHKSCNQDSYRRLSRIHRHRSWRRTARSETDPKHEVHRKEKKQDIGAHSKNVADDIMETACMINDNEFVQAMFHFKGKSPTVILYSLDHLQHMLSCASNTTVIGVDRTFNLGVFFITTTVYQCQSVVHREGSNHHPIFLGPM